MNIIIKKTISVFIGTLNHQIQSNFELDRKIQVFIFMQTATQKGDPSIEPMKEEKNEN